MTGTENTNGYDFNSITCTIKDKKLYDPIVNLSARDNQNYQNFLAESLKNEFIGMNTKQKFIIKI